jgi:hypothetical protein
MEEITKAKLTWIDLSGNEKVVKYNISHNNGLSTVDQDLILTRHIDGTWSANILFDNFPTQDTPQDATNKLAEWMDKLRKALINNNFGIINIKYDLVK